MGNVDYARVRCAFFRGLIVIIDCNLHRFREKLRVA